MGTKAFESWHRRKARWAQLAQFEGQKLMMKHFRADLAERKGRFLPWSGDDKNCSRFEYRKNGIFVATSPGPCQIVMTSLDFRLRAVPLRSVKSKLGRTGESELQSSLSSAGLEKSASSPPLGQFALSSPAELRLDWPNRDCSQSTLTSSYERSYSTYAIQPKNPLKQWTNTTQERGPARGGGGGPFRPSEF